MTQSVPQFAPQRIDALALLGLRDPPGSSGWGSIRAAQLDAAARRALLMFAANLFGAAMVAVIVAPFAGLWVALAWAALTTAVAAAATFRRLGARRHVADEASVELIRDTLLEGVALAAVWSIPPLGFAPFLSPAELAALWMALAVLIALAATALAVLPLATITFSGVVGCAAAAMLAAAGFPVFAAGTGLLTVLMAMICFGRGRAQVLIHAGEIALAERDETVALLLRDREESGGGDWLWEIDPQRRVVRASAQFAESVGVDPADINGRPFLELLAGPTWETGNCAPGLHDLAEKLKHRLAFRDLLLPVTVGGEARWWQMSAKPRTDERGAFLGFRGVGSDVTEARASSDKIQRLARYDTLTGLPNRMQVNEALAHALTEADRWKRRCGLLMVDLDRFKTVNDTLGHLVGDRLLGRVAERLDQLVGGRAVVGRLGGDEFAVVVEEVADPAALARLAREIIATLSRSYEVDQHTLVIGASVGVAVGPRDGRTAETLIRSADLALYRAKGSGGGVACTYEPQLHIAAEERRQLEMALRSAVEKEELRCDYQPVVNALDGTLVGFEALLRWTHPELGPISPAKFIPLAEEARLIAPIGEWVLRTACAEAAGWDDEVRVAVNVSPEQLHDARFAELVGQVLEETGLPPHRLELEVTESVFMREGTNAVRVLEQVLSLGVRLSLDDFGTGYSSLGYLSRTRFSNIKIDRSFVSAASRNEAAALAIIRAVVALAESLGMSTTAEGVETERELSLVRDLGCRKIQGYLFGRPLPVAEARALACRRALRAAERAAERAA